MERLITFDKDKLKEVNINLVRPNSWNPKTKRTKEYEKVRQSIKVNGQRQPIVVREVIDENNELFYEIIDGEQRYTGCLDEGFENVVIYNEGQIDDVNAKALTVWYQVQVPFDKIEEAYLISELSNHISELPYSVEDIANFKKITEFNFDEFEEKEFANEETSKKLNLTFSNEDYEIIEEAIASVKGEEKISNEQALIIICQKYLDSKYLNN